MFTDQPYYLPGSSGEQSHHYEIFELEGENVSTTSTAQPPIIQIDALVEDPIIEDKQVDAVEPIGSTEADELQPSSSQESSDASPTQSPHKSLVETPALQPSPNNIVHLTKRQFEEYIFQNPNGEIVPLPGRPKNVKENGRKTSAFRYQINYLNPKTNVDRLLDGPEAEEWRRAMNDEIKAQNHNKSWTLVKRPEKTKIIDSMWVMKKKFENGSVGYKARLVAKGFTQKYGYDYSETYAPVVRISSIRILLSLALNNDMHVHHVDVKTAYLNSKLDETIYMRQPYLFEAGEEMVCRLEKAIYGLKQSARCWHKKLTSTLKELSFKHLGSDTCICKIKARKVRRTQN